MSSFSVRVITNITKEYPNMVQVINFKSPRYYVKLDVSKRNRELVDDSTYIPSVSSLKRTKTLVRDLVLCNDFDYFATFTFDPNKINSMNFYSCSSCMRKWLHNQRDVSRRKGNCFEYLIIPERHKSGRWHFHALLKGYSSTLKDSTLKSSSGRSIYNITSFRSGFTTAVLIDSKDGVSNYITKYITKDFIKSFNQKRFFCSKGLVRPKRVVNSNVLRDTLPIFRRRVLSEFDHDVYILDI